MSILVRLREGRYDAAVGGDQMEWPPHPARLFCALVASAEHDPARDGFVADTAALRWLEQAGPPVLWAADAVPSQRFGYAVTNSTNTKKYDAGSQFWPGRTARASRRAGALPADDAVLFAWPDATAEDAVLWRLSRLARRVPYLGRSTSTVQIEVGDEQVAARPAWTAYRPVPLGTAGSVLLRVPYPGYLDDLRALYQAGQDSWEISRPAAYAPDGAAPLGPVARPFPELAVFPLQRGVPVSGNGFLTVTEVLRKTVLSRVADPVPPQVSGHGADDSRHVAFLPLLDVGHRHARGHLLGVAVAIPSDMPEPDRLAVVRGLYASTDPGGQDGSAAAGGQPGPIRQLRLGSAGLLRLADPLDEDTDPASPPTWGLQPRRWSGPKGGARRWVTVTPVMLDRYPSRQDVVEDLLAASFVRAGYPEPETVTVVEAPLPRGAITRPRRGTMPQKWGRRPLLHCHVSFPQPVQGPVIAGALRYLGCGLLLPEATT
ncbi:type I-U CRISPR-associated protein Csb2 [Actinoplanes oblitus]|uniref:Type I-U CRISPR-associated protein Csb2 n=1 Tax=Actinoplanes oblitus TaxID=3040509 RepID=A0ABY8WQB9_9ACTN|nr:type I-U CRISPR-associated protein Csb2 [Actinoplanes oblitus]WIN00060.1 type I-U CRISPR-associated protein Csb2 [Actinoplanes oblitus]